MPKHKGGKEIPPEPNIFDIQQEWPPGREDNSEYIYNLGAFTEDEITMLWMLRDYINSGQHIERRELIEQQRRYEFCQYLIMTGALNEYGS